MIIYDTKCNNGTILLPNEEDISEALINRMYLDERVSLFRGKIDGGVAEIGFEKKFRNECDDPFIKPSARMILYSEDNELISKLRYQSDNNFEYFLSHRKLPGIIRHYMFPLMYEWQIMLNHEEKPSIEITTPNSSFYRLPDTRGIKVLLKSFTDTFTNFLNSRGESFARSKILYGY